MKFVFPGVPKAVQSFRYTKAGLRFQPGEVVSWKNYIRLSALGQIPCGFAVLNSPLFVRVNFVFPLPKSATKKNKTLLRDGARLYKTTKPDLTDNLMKGLIDALSGVVWIQDQQICEVQSSKIYGDVPKIEMEVFELPHVLKKIRPNKEKPDMLRELQNEIRGAKFLALTLTAKGENLFADVTIRTETGRAEKKQRCVECSFDEADALIVAAVKASALNAAVSRADTGKKAPDPCSAEPADGTGGTAPDEDEDMLFDWAE